ncbi:MAG: aspartyl protease family protein [Methylococcales bacterium]
MNITNSLQPENSLKCDALVDTGASYLTLPLSLKDRLGDFEAESAVELETATQTIVKGVVCGPVKIKIEGFRAIFNEVLFLERQPEDGEYEPLLGYIVLEQCGAAVDMIGHRLIPVKHMDLKALNNANYRINSDWQWRIAWKRVR